MAFERCIRDRLELAALNAGSTAGYYRLNGRRGRAIIKSAGRPRGNRGAPRILWASEPHNENTFACSGDTVASHHAIASAQHMLIPSLATLSVIEALSVKARDVQT
jgi:hypothetical protein